MPSQENQNASWKPRTAAFLRRHRVLIVLVLADVATKVAAFGLLPYAQPITVVPGLRLYLALNDWGVMGGVHGIGAVTASPAYTMVLALGLFVFAFAILRLGSSSLGFGWRVLAGTAVFFSVAFAAQAVAVPFAHVTMPADVIVATIRLAALTVSLAFYAASTSALPRAAFTLFAAGALGNAASYAYPPFEVVDFLMVPIRPVLALLGNDASSETLVGVINLADLYIFTFPLVLLAWPLSALVLRARGLARG